MLDHFGNFTEIDLPSAQEYELRLRQQTRDAARLALKEILEAQKSAQPGKTGRSLLERISRLFGATKRP